MSCARARGTRRLNCGPCPILCGGGECGPFLELVDHEAPVTCIALAAARLWSWRTPDDGALLVWDARPASSVDRVPVGDAIISLEAPVVCVDICSDRILATAEDGLMKEVALDGGELRRYEEGRTRCLVVWPKRRAARCIVVVGRADLVARPGQAWDESTRPGGALLKRRTARLYRRPDRGRGRSPHIAAPTTLGNDVGRRTTWTVLLFNVSSLYPNMRKRRDTSPAPRRRPR